METCASCGGCDARTTGEPSVKRKHTTVRCSSRMINPIRKKRCKIIRKFIKIIITKRLDRLSSFAKLASGQWPLAICTGYADFAKKNTSKLLIIIFIKTKLCICARNETRICFSSRHYYYLLFRFLFFVVLTLFCTN